MVAFNTIKVGDTLYDCHKVKMGNTTMRRMGTWLVHVKEIDAEKRQALVSWNGNPAKWWSERQLAKLRRTKPAVRKSVLT